MTAEYFPVDFNQLAATVLQGNLQHGENEIAGVKVKTLSQPHPGGSVAYSFESMGAKVIYATDSELDTKLLNPEIVTQDPSAMRKLPDEMLEFFADADLFIGDAQYTDQEYPFHEGWGHARAFTTVDLALQSRVRQLALFHHDPMQSDREMDAKVNACRDRAASAQSDLVIFGAREGLELKIV